MCRRLRLSLFVFLVGSLLAIASNARAADPPTEYRRPELVAIAWKHEGGGKAIQPVWRPDGTLIDQDEAKWLHDELGSLNLNPANYENLPLILIFRIDERTKTPQSLMVSYRKNGQLTPSGAAAHSTKSFLAHSSLAPRKAQMQEWGPEVDFEVMVPIEEPKLLKRIEAVPAEPIEVDKGVWWYVDPRAGRMRAEANAFKDNEGNPVGRIVLGAPAAVLETSRLEADPLSAYTVDVRLKDGSPLLSGYVTLRGDPPALHEIRASRAIEDSNPIVSVEFRRRRHRMERYEKIPTHLELKPR